MIDRSAREFAQRFAPPLRDALERWNARPPSAVRSSTGPPADRALADAPSGPPRILDGIVIVRTRGQQIHAFGPDGEKIWEAGTTRWPTDRNDPLAYPPFIALAPSIGPGGTIVHPIVEPEPPHVGTVAAIGPDGSLRWTHPVEKLPCSSVCIGADGSIRLLLLGRHAGEGTEELPLWLLSLGPDGSPRGVRPTPWTQPEANPIDLIAGPNDVALAIGHGWIGFLRPDGSAACSKRRSS